MQAAFRQALFDYCVEFYVLREREAPGPPPLRPPSRAPSPSPLPLPSSSLPPLSLPPLVLPLPMTPPNALDPAVYPGIFDLIAAGKESSALKQVRDGARCVAPA